MTVSLVPVFNGLSRAGKRLRQFVFGKPDNIPTCDRLKEGNRVLHATHGCGVLVAVDFEDSHDRPYTVRFDNGEEHRYKLTDVGLKLSLIADPPALGPTSQELQDGPANLRRKSIAWISDYEGPAAAPLRRLSTVALGIRFSLKTPVIADYEGPAAAPLRRLSAVARGIRFSLDTPVIAAEAAEVAQDMDSGSESSEDEDDPPALGPTSQEGPTNLRRKSIEWISEYLAAAPLRRLSAFALGHSFTTPVKAADGAEVAQDVDSSSESCKDEATSIIEGGGKRGTASASEKMQPALNVPKLQDKCSVAGCNSPADLALANGKCVACNNAEGTETDAAVPLPSAASLGRSMQCGVIRASSSWGWPVALADANSDLPIEGNRRTSESSRY